MVNYVVTREIKYSREIYKICRIGVVIGSCVINSGFRANCRANKIISTMKVDGI